MRMSRLGKNLMLTGMRKSFQHVPWTRFVLIVHVCVLMGVVIYDVHVCMLMGVVIYDVHVCVNRCGH